MPFQKNYIPWNYKGGRFLHLGYWYILKPDYYKTDKDGYVREHVYVYETFHKCCLLKWGIIHHKDGNRQNNEISNIEGIMRSNHQILHNTGRKKDMADRFCHICKSNKTNFNKKLNCFHWFKDEDKFLCNNCYRKKLYHNKK